MTTLSSNHTTASNTNTTSINSTKGYPFQNINPNDVNYLEFTRDLHQQASNKPFRFNGANEAKSHLTANSRSDNLRSYKENDIKTTLTSTILHE